jgi:hypothetical protein
VGNTARLPQAKASFNIQIGEHLNVRVFACAEISYRNRRPLAAIKPDDGAERIAALRSLKIFDSAPEERLDRLTRLAKRLFDVPITLVSLFDEKSTVVRVEVGRQ